MNKIRILGVIIALAGIISQVTIESDLMDFISGILIGGGIGLVVGVRYRKLKNTDRTQNESHDLGKKLK